MRILALSSWDEMSQRVGRLLATPCEIIRAPETGLIMLRGRIGGTGAAFNLGEATVTRCAVRTPAGLEGHAYIMGRNVEHARAAAICDALLQDEAQHAQINATVVAPLALLLEQRRTDAGRKAAATKVDFFTLVRGEND